MGSARFNGRFSRLAAAQSFLDLRLLYGQQADAFTWASLPLGRGLA